MGQFPQKNQVQRAYLGKSFGDGSDATIRFQYNPTSFKDQNGVKYTEINSLGISYPLLQYVGGKTRRVTFDIYVNGKGGDGGSKPVHDVVNKLNTFTPDAFGNQFQAPPTLTFGFGWFVKECLLEDFTPNYTEFSPELEPLEATISVTLIVIQS